MPKQLQTFGRITAGKLSLLNREAFIEALAVWYDYDIDVSLTVKPLYGKRTKPQNKYYRGVVVPIITDAINVEWGDELTHDEVHELLKQQFNSHIVTMSNGQKIKVAKSTAKLTTVEMATYIEKCIRFAAEMFGIKIPEAHKVIKPDE